MVGKGKRKIVAIGYMRTSVGQRGAAAGGDRELPQAAGYTIVDWFYDPAVKGSDAVT